MIDMQLEFEAGNDKEYKVDGIWDSAVYAKELAKQLLGLYYLVLCKIYRKEKNIWEPALAIQHIWRLITTYHKNNPEKSIAIYASINMVPLMAGPSILSKPTTKPITDILIKQKQGQLVGSTTTK